ncbi:uncharacterized protein LOC121800876 [Salvia splendens]|uniref:uncharacterized protein LOC121800876 n=1 Tax=Salvia splendens TaxID=180675 RepID=UPI001C274B6B|nr:uncharacterized protein LOC121800876 [Salvia splendens]
MLPNGDFDTEVYEDEKDWDDEEDGENESMPQQEHLVEKRGAILGEGRVDMWNKLRELAARLDGCPWLVGGDFNIYVSEEERQGSMKRQGRKTREMMEFVKAISDCKLLDVGADGLKFTWASGNTFERLDRVLLGEGWANIFESTRVTNLPRILSDHCPLLDDTGTKGMINVQLKLSRLKRSLKIWNRVVFGNIFERLKKVKWKEASERYEQNPSPDMQGEMNRATVKFLLRLKMEEDFWGQKAALKWVAEGERNTRFFQGWVKQKRTKSRIHMIEEGDQVLTDEMDIRNSAERFFKGLLTDDVGLLDEPDLEILSVLPPQVNMELLEKAPSVEVIKQTVFSINAESAAGPDGYSALFFQSCWDIIGGDVVEAVLNFFAGAHIPLGIAATLIVLVPKKKDPTRWAEFRPISLCNVMNKIISKILTSRLALLLPLLTVPNQSRFIKGRLLSDNVLLAKELFHEIWKSVSSPNMVLKLDMEKAYDRVQWPFLIKVLGKMGFSDKWLRLIGNYDIMVFSQAKTSSLRLLTECLSHYMKVSGQKVNVGKSCFYLDKKHVAWARDVREVLEPTKGALKQIEQVMARFLWGSCNTSKKTHWINWQRVCLPTDEGGLGIRSLADSVEAFSLTMWWRFREQDSLWARSNRFSPMWRRLFKVGDLCKEDVRWVVGEGNISFWFDSCVTNFPLASISNARPVRTSLKVKDLWMGEQWNEVKLWMMSEEEGLPEEVVERILQIPIDTGVRDRGRWKLSGNGEFSTASAWELVRNRAANRIPVDTKMQWTGIALASMCRCCKNPQVESRLHLFVNGKAARRIWLHFARWFPHASEFGEVGENLEERFRWWQRQLGARSGHHLCTIIPCLIL